MLRNSLARTVVEKNKEEEEKKSVVKTEEYSSGSYSSSDEVPVEELNYDPDESIFAEEAQEKKC